MDSVTQFVLGSSVAAIVAPTRQRRAALLAGGLLASVPDLDTLWLSLVDADPMTAVTWHRGPTHSLLVLSLFGWGIWKLLLRRGWLVTKAPRRWLWAILLALLTHPLLDAFTVYGTQLFWPFPMRPLMISSIFVIDPLYTLPMVLGCTVSWLSSPPIRKLSSDEVPKPVWTRHRSRNWVVAGLMLSSLYLGWSVLAKSLVVRAAQGSLGQLGLLDGPTLVTPTPFNTFLWRVVVMAPGGYWVGYRSLLVDQGSISFHFYPSDTASLAEVSGSPDVKRLRWFTHGFLEARTVYSDARHQWLVLSDLRMGFENQYVFRYRIGEREIGSPWQLKERAELLPQELRVGPTLQWLGTRLFHPLAGPPPQ